MPNGVTIEKGLTVDLTFTNGVMKLNMWEIDQDHHAVARISENGPILASTPLVPFWAQGNVDGYLWITESYEDSELWQNRMIFKNLPDNVDIKISVVTSGVTLDDSTLVRWLTKADLDELGQYDIGLIVPKGIDSEGCHRVQLYQDGVYLGEAYFAETGMPGPCNSESGVNYRMEIKAEAKEVYCAGKAAVIKIELIKFPPLVDASEPVEVMWWYGENAEFSDSTTLDFGDPLEIQINAEYMTASSAPDDKIITIRAVNHPNDLDLEHNVICEAEKVIKFSVVKVGLDGKEPGGTGLLDVPQEEEASPGVLFVSGSSKLVVQALRRNAESHIAFLMLIDGRSNILRRKYS